MAWKILNLICIAYSVSSLYLYIVIPLNDGKQLNICFYVSSKKVIYVEIMRRRWFDNKRLKKLIKYVFSRTTMKTLRSYA